MMPDSQFHEAPEDKEQIYRNIINPMAQQKREWKICPLVERPESLENKTVYIINQKWGGAKAHEPLLLGMKRWLEEHVPGIKVEYRVKLSSYGFNDVRLWQEVAENADAALIGVPH
jgi:hypothetical protein